MGEAVRRAVVERSPPARHAAHIQGQEREAARANVLIANLNPGSITLFAILHQYEVHKSSSGIENERKHRLLDRHQGKRKLHETSVLGARREPPDVRSKREPRRIPRIELGQIANATERGQAFLGKVKFPFRRNLKKNGNA